MFTRPDWNGVRAFELSGSGITATYPAYSVVDDVNNVTTASFFFEITDTNNLDQLFGVRYHSQLLLLQIVVILKLVQLRLMQILKLILIYLKLTSR